MRQKHCEPIITLSSLYNTICLKLSSLMILSITFQIYSSAYSIQYSLPQPLIPKTLFLIIELTNIVSVVNLLNNLIESHVFRLFNNIKIVYCFNLCKKNINHLKYMILFYSSG